MNRKYLLLGGVGLVLIVAIIGFAVVKGQSKSAAPTAEPTPTPEIVDLLPQDALSISLKKGSNNQYVLTIDKIPQGVKSLSYEITYDTSNKGTQGIVGSPTTLKEGQAKYTNDQILFGTCSRGKCVFDQGVSNIAINVRLMFKDGSEKGWKGTLEL